jgi:predicted XRE-type DNA-binding protein
MTSTPKMSESESITESTGNVFEDIGFDKAEAASLLLRSRLMLALERRLRAESKTQKELGAILRIGQSRVSDLLKHKAELFSLDMLVTLTQRLGLVVTVDVGVTPARISAAVGPAGVFVSSSTAPLKVCDAYANWSHEQYAWHPGEFKGSGTDEHEIFVAPPELDASEAQGKRIEDFMAPTHVARPIAPASRQGPHRQQGRRPV